MPAVTAADMRAIDRLAVEETGPYLFQMMENAGRSLALQAIEVVGPIWRERHVLVLADIGIPADAFRRAGFAFVSPFGDRFRIPLTIS